MFLLPLFEIDTLIHWRTQITVDGSHSQQIESYIIDNTFSPHFFGKGRVIDLGTPWNHWLQRGATTLRNLKPFMPPFEIWVWRSTWMISNTKIRKKGRRVEQGEDRRKHVSNMVQEIWSSNKFFSLHDMSP